jgi:replicative DNA helicase
MVSFVGRPQAGKTMQMLYAAHTSWWEQKRNILLVSMEMKPLPIHQRLSAMHVSIPMTWVKNAELSTKALQKLSSH